MLFIEVQSILFKDSHLREGKKIQAHSKIMNKIKFYLHAWYNDNLTPQNCHYLFTSLKNAFRDFLRKIYLFYPLYAFSLSGTENKML